MYSLSLMTLLAMTLGSHIAAQEQSVPVAAAASHHQDSSQVHFHEDDDEDDDESLFTWGLKAKVIGLDYDNMTPEHEAFLEDALAFSFNKVYKNTDKSAVSSHLVGKKKGDDNGSEVLRGAVGVRRTIPSIWRYWGSYSCRFCAPDRRWLSSPDSPTDVSLESSRQLERWENYFCRMLQTSDYDTLQDAHDCRFRVSHDGRENDDDDEDEYQVPLLKQTKLLL